MKKRILSLVLVLVFILGLAGGAYADPNDTVIPRSIIKTEVK